MHGEALHNYQHISIGISISIGGTFFFHCDIFYFLRFFSIGIGFPLFSVVRDTEGRPIEI